MGHWSRYVSCISDLYEIIMTNADIFWIDDGESILDVELLNGIGSGATNWYWTIADGWYD